MKLKNQKSVLPNDEHVKLVTVNEDGTIKNTKVFAQAKNIPKEYNKYIVQKVSSVTNIPMEASVVSEPTGTEPEKLDGDKKENTSAPNARRQTRNRKPSTYPSGTEIQVKKPLSKKKRKKNEYLIERIEEDLRKWQ